MNSLDPVYRLRAQMHEVLRRRGGLGRKAADARADELFRAVGLSPGRLRDYPHQFSGGMRQRAAIALALALSPRLVVADEPVTALDVIVQRQVLDTFRTLGEQVGAAAIFVTHDISVVAYLCSTVAVMYAGRVVEHGPAATVLARPAHPYTMGLMNAFPDLEGPAQALAPIRGAPPDLHDPPQGCRFAARCPFAVAPCADTDPAAVPVADGHGAACHRAHEAEALRMAARAPRPGNDRAPGRGHGAAEALPRRADPAPGAAGERPAVHAVDDVDLRLMPGESVGLVGESGSGKTTVGRLLLKLTEPSGGAITFGPDRMDTLRGDKLRRFRQQAQLVFQNPFDAINPRFTVRRTVAEPLINTGVPRAEHEERVAAALRLVHLGEPSRWLDKRPSEMSGGQLQRVVLARALAVRPQFLVADEPVSMLDVSVRAGILNLLRELKDGLGLTALYISHDLTLVRYVCERTLVMYLGRIVEDGPTEAVVTRPGHPYTQALIQAVPRPRTDQPRGALPIHGGLGDPVNPPSGCRLRDRCPYAFDRCVAEVPALAAVAPGHRVACHLHTA